jgi:hypothetical protein
MVKRYVEIGLTLAEWRGDDEPTDADLAADIREAVSENVEGVEHISVRVHEAVE